MAKIEIRTPSQIKKAIKDSTKTTAYPIAGYAGLEINVRVNAKGQAVADFRHRYTHPITGKRPYMTLGAYLALSLEQARQAYHENLALLVQGIDPIEHRQAEKQKEITDRKNTMQYFINEWKANQQGKQLAKSTLDSQARLIAMIEKSLGKRKVTDIKPSDVIGFIKTIQKAHVNKGLKVKNILKSILQIAKASGVIEYNPASDLKGTLTTHKTKHQPAITTPPEFAKLLQDIDGLPDDNPKFEKQILQLLTLTFARIGDICKMTWADIDLLAKQWEFKPEKVGGRGDMMDSLIIPLPLQAVAILERMQAITGGQTYVFYNAGRKKDKHTHRQEINKLLNSPAMNDGKGYKDIQTPHGFRASAKTMLMERLGYDELITELQLGHRMLNRYGKAYSRMDMLTQRRAMMTDWGNYLDDLKAGKIDNVMYMSKAGKPAQPAKAVNN